MSNRKKLKSPTAEAAVSSSRKAVTWFSNAPWAGTGYGTQAQQVLQRMAADGRRVAVSTNYGFEAGNTSVPMAGVEVPVYGCGFGQWRADALQANARHFSATTGLDPFIITLCDVWTFKPDDVGDIPVLSWTPVDHAPIPPRVAKWFELPNVRAVAMSKFGQAMFEGAGIDAVYIPHAFDSTIFKPTPLIDLGGGNVKSGRELLSIGEDRFVVGMNSANKGVVPNRKAFGENLMAFSIFAKRHDDALLYLHTEQFGAMGGIDLVKLIKACGIPERQVHFVDQYAYRSQISASILAGIYSAMDVLLACSRGEGFGIPVIEAQACGVPVIVSDWTAQPELVGDGWVTAVQPEWDATQDAWFATPIINDIVDALEQAYQRGRGVSQLAVESMRRYDADYVYETMWRPLLDEVGV